MNLTFSLSELRTSNGTSVPLEPSSTVVFVGPNNAGKSQALRDIGHQLQTKGLPDPLVVVDLDVAKDGDGGDLVAWLEANASRSPANAADFARRGLHVQERQATSWWETGPPFQQLAGFFMFHAEGSSRLDLASPAPTIDFMQEAPAVPLHHLYNDYELESAVSDLFYEAFGTGLILDRTAGAKIPLRIGSAPAGHPGSAFTTEYREEIRARPLLHEQGDGMRAFTGLALHVLFGGFPLALIDEPEAFLHPPQARLLGRLLASRERHDAQLIVATHSADILRGMLDAPGTPLTIVRLQREGPVNRTKVLRPEQVRRLWDDPLLRYSNILDGLFHEAVVLCEADADCRFYASVLDVLVERQQQRRRPDILFTHCSGKAKMPKVVEALRALDVPVAVVADLDLLGDKELLRRLVAACGGTWDKVEDDWSVISAALHDKAKAPEINTVRAEILELLGSTTEHRLTPTLARSIRRTVKIDRAWGEIKERGLDGIPPGIASERAESLMATLADLGIHLVPKGELESFIRVVGNKGAAWVREVHERKLHEDAAIARDAWEFLRRAMVKTGFGHLADPTTEHDRDAGELPRPHTPGSGSVRSR